MTRRTRVLVAGNNGQLARALASLAGTAPDLDLRFFSREELDITDAGACQATMDRLRPDLVLNAAAYTNVDGAERHHLEAETVNTVGAGNLARAAATRETPVIHVSTDYVFDGSKPSAYDEADATHPVNTYGITKLAGEEQVRLSNPKHLVVRTAWLYSPYGRNFVSKLLAAASSGHARSIVADQIGNPTSAQDLAKALTGVARRLASIDWNTHSGVYHLAGPEPMSRFDWARLVISLSSRMHGPGCPILAATTGEFPTPAARPLRTALNSSRFQEVFGFDFPPPEASLGDVLRSILQVREGVS
ncbi:dTDP-4-dehydrorhamnose reductase [Roseibium sp. M-1]